MKNEMIQRIRKNGKSATHIMNSLREDLHHLLLFQTDLQGGFRDICFVGGTALRILYGLDRFSEDLDFSTSGELSKKFSLSKLANHVALSIKTFGFDCQIQKLQEERTVQSCFFVFSNLLNLAHKTFQPGQKLAIKFEVDTNPPLGGVKMYSPIVTERIYKIRHYDLPSLFAGKLNAILCRQYTKGKDLYDFLWYVGQGIKVNRVLLENGLAQAQGKKQHLDDHLLRKLLAERFEKTDFNKARLDVLPFLVNQESTTIFEKTLFLDAIKKWVNSSIFSS